MNEEMNSNINTKDIVKEIYTNRFRIIIVSLVISVVTAGVSLLLPNEFKSTANLFPNPNRGIGFDIFAENGGIQSLASSFLGGKSNEANRFYVLLESYNTKLAVVENFNLVEVYETTDSETPTLSAIEILTENLNFESKEEGNFVIEVWDKDPVRAKEINDFLIEELSKRNNEISSKEASYYRSFIEGRYNETLTTLNNLTDSLEFFQTEFGVLELPTQVESYLSVLANLSVNKYTAEIKVDLLENTLNKSNSTYKSAVAELNAIEEKLSDAYNDSSNETLELSFNEIPSISKKYFYLVENIKVQTEILKFIVPLVEQAKMDQAKSIPVVSIIDSPRVPELKDKPRRSILVILSFISSMIIMTLYTLISLSVRKNQDILNEIFK